MNRINNYNGCSVSEFSKLLHVHLDSCTKAAKLKVSGASKEMCKAAFYKMMAACVLNLTALSEDHQMTMWLCANMSGEFWTSPSRIEAQSTDITQEDADVAHYICCFVRCKLRQRKKLSEYKEVLSALESAEEPKPKTLLTAKSRGQLSNLSKDAKAF